MLLQRVLYCVARRNQHQHIPTCKTLHLNTYAHSIIGMHVVFAATLQYQLLYDKYLTYNILNKLEKKKYATNKHTGRS